MKEFLRSQGSSAQIFATILLLASFPIHSIHAGRPLTIDDAEPVGAGEFEFEAGTAFIQDGRLEHWHFPLGLTYGLAPQLELGVSSGGSLQERGELETGDDLATGFSDVIIGAKGQFAKQADWLADQSLAFAVKIPTASRREGLGTGEFDFDLAWILSRRLTDEVSIHFNAGYSWLGNPPGEDLSNIFHTGLAAGWQAHPKVELVSEVFADMDGVERVFVNGGARWEAVPNLVLDAAVGSGIHGGGSSVVITFGFTWTFGPFGSGN